jgi:hypothetical protein
LLRDARNQFRFDHLRDFGQHLNSVMP